MMQNMRLHPDLGGDEALAQQLNEAAATLCKVDSREQYDLWLAANASAATPPGGRPNTETSSREDKSAEAHRDTSARGHTADQPYRSSSTQKTHNRVQLPSRKQCFFCHAASGSATVGLAGYQGSNRCAQCKGATTPIENISLGSADDIRKIYRHTHESQVWLNDEWPLSTAIPATMTDLSIAGCAINCATALASQSVIMLDTQLFNSICQVRYQKQLGSTELYSIGLEFLTLDIFAAPGSVFSATA